jgi:hypothetical protein
MHRLLLRTAAGLALAQLVALGSAFGSEPPRRPVESSPFDVPKAEAPVCSAHSTKIDFVDTPKEAAALAKKEQKLVFVLHVSGNFEDPRFT